MLMSFKETVLCYSSRDHDMKISAAHFTILSSCMLLQSLTSFSYHHKVLKKPHPCFSLLLIKTKIFLLNMKVVATRKEHHRNFYSFECIPPCLLGHGEALNVSLIMSTDKALDCAANVFAGNRSDGGESSKAWGSESSTNILVFSL
jgi:hypothetical protein